MAKYSYLVVRRDGWRVIMDGITSPSYPSQDAAIAATRVTVSLWERTGDRAEICVEDEAGNIVLVYESPNLSP